MHRFPSRQRKLSAIRDRRLHAHSRDVHESRINTGDFNTREAGPLNSPGNAGTIVRTRGLFRYGARNPKINPQILIESTRARPHGRAMLKKSLPRAGIRARVEAGIAAG